MTTLDHNALPTIPVYTPLSNITPFTYRDGLTYLQVLETLRRYVNLVVTNENTQNTTINEFVDDMVSRYEDILASLIGYTIEIDENTYRASMMDGSVFEAYTITGTDARLNLLEQAINQSFDTFKNLVDSQINDIVSDFNDFRTLVNNALDGLRDDFADYKVEVADTIDKVDDRRSGLLRTNIEHGMYGSIPYTVVRVINNESNDAGKHVELKLAVKDNPTTGFKTMDEFAHDHRATIAINAFATNSNAGLSSIAIVGGTIVLDWVPGEGRYSGVEAIARMNDGTFRTYKKADGHTAASMVADGVLDAWGFGPLVLENGIVRNLDANPGAWGSFAGLESARTITGYNARGDFIVIISTGRSNFMGIKGNQLGQIALNAGCTNAVVNDGGGSTQLYVNGQYERTSSDPSGRRERRGAVLIHDVVPSITGSKWQTLPLESGFSARYSDDPAMVRMVDETYQFKGVVEVPTMASGEQRTLAWLPNNISPPKNERDALSLGQVAWEMARLRLAGRQIQISSMGGELGTSTSRNVHLSALSGLTM